MRESSVEIILLPQINHTSMDVGKEKREGHEGAGSSVEKVDVGVNP